MDKRMHPEIERLLKKAIFVYSDGAKMQVKTLEKIQMIADFQEAEEARERAIDEHLEANR